MIIYTYASSGFCNGVKNAINLALSCKGERKYTFGKLVHNQSVVEKLRDAGICEIQDFSQLKAGDNLIIRAHGAGKSTYDYCAQNGIVMVDATCPFVKKIQLRAQEYYNNGYQIVLIGDKSHPEIIGVNGWCNNSAIITDGSEKIDLTCYEKVLVMFQTTFLNELVASSLRNLLTYNVKMLEIFNTICYTTIDRQNYANFVSICSDIVYVVGDRQSSNTNKLFEIAHKYNKNTFWIDDIEDFQFDFSHIEKVGVISGASTPKELIEEVLERMEQAKENVEVVEVTEDVIAEASANTEVVEKVVTTEVVDKHENTTVSVEDTNGEIFANAIAKIPEGKKYRSGQKIKCSVEIIDDSGITVKIPYWKQNGFIPNEELSSSLDPATAKTKLKRGDVIECSILSTEGGLKLSRKVIEILYKDDELVDGIKLGNEFEIVMQKAVKGGLLGNLGSYKVFVPASQIRNGFVKTLEQYEGKKLKLVALPDSVDEVKHKIVASARAVIMKEKQEKEDNFWNNIEVDEIVEGKVLRFAPFGAFVSVRGFDCLAHLSDLSWTPVKEPAEVLELNKTYEFVVLKLDREANRVSIGYKQLQPQPWQQASDKFPIGAVVKGKVARILPFGAFVELDKGIDGLLHISNVSWEWLGDINQVLKVGDEIEVQVIGFDIDAKRITLSRKSLLEKPAELPEHNNEHESQE